MDDDQAVLDLMRKIRELEGENERLRSALFSVSNPFHGEMGLTRQLANIAYALYENDVVPAAKLDAIISEYGWKGSSNSALHIDMRLKVTITRLRNRLRPHGIDVLAVRGLGYKLTDEGRKVLGDRFRGKIEAANLARGSNSREGSL